MTLAANTPVGTYTVVVYARATGNGNYYNGIRESTVTVTVVKADASRDVPEKALSFTGQPQPLVTAGTVSGGTLQYALGTDDVTAPADGWSTEIPTATEPGKYFVWYRVVGDENHNGVDPACIVVTIAEPIPEETPAATPAAPESVSDYTLLASMKTSGNKALKLKWTAVSGAEGYDVFLGDCGGGECELKKTVTGQSCKIGKLKKGNAYKAFVKAWKTENGQKVYIGQASPDVHAVAGGKSNRYTNAKKISVKKKKLTVAVGGSKKIKASLKKFSNSRRYLNHTAKIRYFSSNRAVATVNAKGKVTGVAPGTCTVYAVAENGLRKGVKITVK
jgi:hypothetical protein